MTSMSQPHDPPPPNPKVQVPVLVERAKRALEEGRAAEAVELMRQAKAIAPFRNDVREMMVAALQARAEAAQSGPQPLRIHTRGPLFASGPAAGEPAHEIEMIELGRPEPVASPEPDAWGAEEAAHDAAQDAAHNAKNAAVGYEPEDASFHPADSDSVHGLEGADAERWAERAPVVEAAPDLFDAPSEGDRRADFEACQPARFERSARSAEPRRPAPEPAAEPDNDSPDRLISSTVPAPAAVGAPMWPPDRALGGRRAGPGGDAALSARPARGRVRMALAAAALLGFLGLGGAAFFVFSGRNPRPEVAPLTLEELGQMRKDRARRDLVAAADQYLKQSKFALAIEQLEMLEPGEDKEKRLASAYAHQAESYYKSRQHDDARKFYELALQHDPKNSDYSFEIGWMHYYMGREAQDKNRDKAKGRFAEAERFFSDALRMNENNTRALYGLAKVEIARSNRSGAAEYYKRLLRVNPDTREGKEARDSLAEWRVLP